MKYQKERCNTSAAIRTDTDTSYAAITCVKASTGPILHVSTST